MMRNLDWWHLRSRLDVFDIFDGEIIGNIGLIGSVS